MGVQGLWELLAPVGRRVSVETLSGKKLAIDASIWMVQFMKAMRDERGEMVRNAHLLGFFRRICKLLFLRTKPVFVFDGGTPALKRRTVAARRRHRENARAKIRKTAEKLLLNHFKSKRLEELAEEIKRSKSDVKDGSKGNKKVDSAEYGSSGLENHSSSVRNDQGFVGDNNQECLDELLAASIAAEEEGKLLGTEPAPTDDAKYEEEGEEDGEEEMILPLNCKNIDPAVLASLPPSMQLDLLVQMRERLMADNRQKYQTIKKVPAKFSELQIQSYLKTVAFRREIDEVQKCASGRGFGGLQTSRIASEANREYIFSSSFTGDKNMLTPTSTEKNGSTANQELMKTSASDTSKRKLFLNSSNSTTDTNSEEVASELFRDVETYTDDRGRARVSRVRGLGIHMTRDLQRNLDLMKEYEKVFDKHDLRKVSEPSLRDESGFQKGHSKTEGIPIPSLISGKSSHCYTSTPIARERIDEEIERNTGRSAAVSVKEAAIEISFSEDEIESNPMVDNFFVSLVSEKPTTELFSESASMDKKMDDSESECIWEDGVVGELYSSLNFDDNKLSYVESKGYEEDKVVWEETVSSVSRSVESQKAVSLGFLEEEADMKEAIRRSLEDIKLKRLSSAVPVEAYTITTVEDQNSLISTNNDLNIENLIGNGQSQSVLMGQPQSAVMDCMEESSHRGNARHFIASQKEHLSASLFASRLDVELTIQDEKNNIAVCSNDLGLSHDNQVIEKRTNLSPQENLCCSASKQMVDEPNFGKTDVHTKNYTETDFENPCSRIDTDFGDPCDDSVPCPSTGTFGISSSMPSSSRSVPELGIDLSKLSPTEQITSSIDEMQQLASSEAYKDFSKGLSKSAKTSVQDEDNIVALKASLHNEISFLEQERAYLGDEQRKLERNADSVSSEMFAECQELLQMFGLPYIIAPMEAEAQCAYMEMTDLVDGIVTDDSDVFLFGARNVYKNIFDDRKYVETYFMKEIESELGLSRDKLIRIALLLGSDYTEGVSGIGIVNAIEVINAFPEKDGLQKFKDWVESPDPAIFGDKFNKKMLDAIGNAACGMKENLVCSESIEGAHQSSENTISDAKSTAIFMDEHRNVSKNWHFPPSFPSDSVISAYLSPQIDDSTERFAWGKPDFPLLRKVCWEKFGWPNQKADELLVPVLKEYNKHETQLRMEAFYSFNERFAKIRSQRIKKAVKGIAGVGSTVLSDNSDGDKVSKSKSRNRLRKKVPEGGHGKATAGGRPKGEGREALNDEPPLPEARSSNRRCRRVNYAEDNAEINEVGAPDEAGPELDSASGEVFDHGGGGFCPEENGNENNAPGPGCNFAISGGGVCMMEEGGNPSFGEGVSAKLSVPGDLCRNQMKGDDDDAIDCEAAAGSFLRAMPSLRRKRRKK